MTSKSFIIYFCVALLAITVLWASKAAAAPGLCKVQLGRKQMKSPGVCTAACKKQFGVLNNGARCLKKKTNIYNTEGLRKWLCWCNCFTKKKKNNACPAPIVDAPPSSSDDDSSSDSSGDDSSSDSGGDDKLTTTNFMD
ncbi:hypothetical protein ABFS83_14G192400 [Erythranthe nasuta]